MERYKVRIRIQGCNPDRVRLWSNELNDDLLKAIQHFVPELTDLRWTHMIKHVHDHRGTGVVTAAHVAYDENDVGSFGTEIWIEKVW